MNDCLHLREWYNGSIVAFQAIDPGSTPGSRNFFAICYINTVFILVTVMNDDVFVCFVNYNFHSAKVPVVGLCEKN